MNEVKFRLVIKDHGTYEVRKMVWDLEEPNDLLDIDVIMDGTVQSVKALFSPGDWKSGAFLLAEWDDRGMKDDIRG